MRRELKWFMCWNVALYYHSSLYVQRWIKCSVPQHSQNQTKKVHFYLAFRIPSRTSVLSWKIAYHLPDSITVEHILISCIDFDIIRQNFYTASNLKDLFHNIHPKRIISFVHAIGLTNKLNFLRHDIAATCVLKMPLNPNHPSIHPVFTLRNFS